MNGMAAYSAKAQPYLDAIAQVAFASQSVRDWLLRDTSHAARYAAATSLHSEQAAARPDTKQPFHCNDGCGRGSRCTCRPEGSTGLETDLMLFLGARDGRRFAVHVEVKHPGEPLRPGEADADPLRAASWARGAYQPGSVIPHDDWLTVILRSDEERTSPTLAPFQRRICHSEARGMMSGHPA